MPYFAGPVADERDALLTFLGVPRAALVTLQVAAHYPEDCPLCKQGIPVEKPGSK